MRTTETQIFPYCPKCAWFEPEPRFVPNTCPVCNVPRLKRGEFRCADPTIDNPFLVYLYRKWMVGTLEQRPDNWIVNAHLYGVGCRYTVEDVTQWQTNFICHTPVVLEIPDKVYDDQRTKEIIVDYDHDAWRTHKGTRKAGPVSPVDPIRSISWSEICRKIVGGEQ
jgi:hypothetical protein